MRRLAQLSKKIKEIMEELAKLGSRPTEEDGMFTKKPFGPVACAACEKNLINIQGMAVDYHVWKKLPFREPGERLARYGQGFSKILANMKGSVDVMAEHSIDGQQVHHSHSTGPETDAYASHGYKTHSGGFYGQGKTQGGNRV